MNNKIAVTGIGVESTGYSNRFFQIMRPGETYKLKGNVWPRNATNSKILWESKEPDIVSVNNKGLITAKKNGLAEIIIMSDENKSIFTCYRVLVESY